MISQATRAGAWALYTAGWLLFGVMELYVLRMTQNMAWLPALESAVTVTLPGALLGCGLWKISEHLSWRRGWTRFLVLHFFLALTYSVLWDGAIYLELVIFLGEVAARGIVKSFIVWQIQLGMVAYAVMAAEFYVVRLLTELREEEHRSEKSETLRIRAELEALKGKLQPHFLFNTLHTLTALVRTDPRQAEQALLKLGEVLRYVLQMKKDGVSDDVSLAQEWTFVQQYLAIEQIRLGERLRIHAEMSPAALDCAVPIFSLQPLVENAVNYAIAPRAQGGNLHFLGRVVSGRLELEVADDGPGADPAAVEKSKGFGLRVVRQRLALRFPEASALKVNTRPGGGCRVLLSCPAVEASG